ncbi:FabA-like domain-containing protein [Roseateles sp. YR242]|uniref:AMP-binding protein n=1 Tax=Roseateles sp. YR242 TaxID=1855305 RepID=UPI0008D66B48|nr:AMP-binding protein [Roseateles sp. YR242]SEL71159.1 FabA-like domain-containing protein [Roseateles sp. YR242]
MKPSERLASLLAQPVDAAGAVGWRGAVPVSWSDFSHLARSWQTAFELAAGQCFVLFFSDGLEFAAALFGLWQAGKQAWLPGDLTPATQSALRPHVAGWAGDGAGVDGVPRLQAAERAAPFATKPLSPQAEGLVVFTSGSTGAPTACVKQLRQLFDEVDALEQAFGAPSAGGTVVASVSPQHVYGLLFRVLWPLATGRTQQARTLVYLEDLAELLPSAQAGSLAASSPAVLVASPTHLGRLPVQVPAEAARVRQVFSSGAPLPDSAVPDALRVFGHAPIEVFGSTETGGVAWRQRNRAAPVFWQALPGVQWRLDDGRLELRSPHLQTDDWTPGADRAVAVASGFELQGRADRVVKIAEKRVSLQAVEERLLKGGMLSALRLVMLDDPRVQLGVVAVPSAEGWALHDSAGRRALAGALRQQLLGVVERVALPRRWRFLPELPRNAQGKSTQARLLSEFDPRRPALREITREGGKVMLTLQVDAALPQFDGHFPDHPVLPGVAQLEWAVLFGHECFDITGAFSGLEALKFQRVVTPGTQLMLTLEWQAANRLTFQYQSVHGPHASGRVLFGAPT